MLYQTEILFILGTDQLILERGVLWNLYEAGMIFLKFFNKPMQREIDFERENIFRKFQIPPPPPPPPRESTAVSLNSLGAVC